MPLCPGSLSTILISPPIKRTLHIKQIDLQHFYHKNNISSVLRFVNYKEGYKRKTSLIWLLFMKTSAKLCQKIKTPIIFILYSLLSEQAFFVFQNVKYKTENKNDTNLNYNILTSDWTIPSPKPQPSCTKVFPLTCTKFSKIDFCFSFGIPFLVSSTSNNHTVRGLLHHLKFIQTTKTPIISITQTWQTVPNAIAVGSNYGVFSTWFLDHDANWDVTCWCKINGIA